MDKPVRPKLFMGDELQPRNEKQAQSWVEEFEKSFQKRWDGHMIEMEQIVWGTHPSQKQQHMTTVPVSSNDEFFIDQVAAAMRECDKDFEKVGGSTRHYVRDLLLPKLEQFGIHFSREPIQSPIKDYQHTPAELHQLTTDKDHRREYYEKPQEGSVGVLASQVAGKPGQTEAATITDGNTQFHKYTDHGIQNLQSQGTQDIQQKHKQKSLADYVQPKQTEPVNIPGGASAFIPKTTYRFGMAIEFLEVGKKMARVGWNGKHMFVYYVPAASYPPMTEVAKSFFGENLVPYNPYFAIKNVDGTVSTWGPSNNDCLAKDWYIVE